MKNRQTRSSKRTRIMLIKLVILIRIIISLKKESLNKIPQLIQTHNKIVKKKIHRKVINKQQKLRDTQKKKKKLLKAKITNLKIAKTTKMNN
jgi:hypothetical protein